MITWIMTFEPMNFVENLRYMGLGMLGIFLVIGVITILTTALNALTTKQDQSDEKSHSEVDK